MAAALLGAAAETHAQSYDLLLRGGHVLDARNGVDGVADVAVRDGRIAAVGQALDVSRAERVLDASGLYVVPGLVDLHVHVFHGTEDDAYLSNGYAAVVPDGFTLRAGVTTAVDLGGAGWKSFPRFKSQVIDRARTRILSFLNIVGAGMRGGPAEQDLSDMDARLTAMRALEHPEHVVGIKLAHYAGPEWTPVDRAIEAGRLAGVPVAVDFGGHDPPLDLESLLVERLRPGDIFTHAYAHVPGRTPIVDAAGRLRPFVLRAQERGVVFDVGHGGASFVFEQAAPAVEQGLWPDTISSDLHRGSMNGAMKDMTNVLSKMLALGMPLDRAVAAATWAPARVIGREDLGHLGEGAPADVAVLRLREGDFGFTDTNGVKVRGSQRIECELTLREGAIVWDLNGLAASERPR